MTNHPSRAILQPMQALKRWFRQQAGWIESQQVSILSAATIILCANIVSALAGVVRSRVLSSVYVTPAYQDGKLLESFWVAFRAPEFAYQFIVLGALSAAFIPLFVRWYHKDRERAFQLAYQTMYLLLGLFLLASLLIAWQAERFSHFMTGPSFDAQQISLAAELTRIMMISQFFFGISGFFSAMLQGTKRFIIPAFSPIVYNLGIIFMALLAEPYLGLHAAAWGTVLGAVLHMGIQVPFLHKIGFPGWRWPHWRRDDLRDFFALTAPRTFALGASQLTLWVVTFFATSLGGIALTMITFAQQLMGLPIRLFGVSIGQAALPFLSAEQSDIVGFRSTVFRSIRQIMFFAVPASVLLIVLRVPVVRLAYGTSEFPWRATLDTAQALAILSVSAAPQAATHLLMRAFYALNDTLTPLVISLGYLLTTAAVGWYLVIQQQMGLSGIAWALSLAALVESITLLTILLMRIGWGDLPRFLSAVLRIAAAGFLMAITLFIFQRLLDLYVFETSRTWQLLQLTISVSALGGAVYIAFCWFLQIEELTILENMADRVSKWRKVSKVTPEFVGSAKD